MHKLPRETALSLMRAVGAQGDRKTFTRLYVENRISRAVADEAWREGKRFGEFVRKRDETLRAEIAHERDLHLDDDADVIEEIIFAKSERA